MHQTALHSMTEVSSMSCSWSYHISQRLEAVFLDESDADVSLKCAEGGTVMCHSFVLSLHSDELRDALIKSEGDGVGENGIKYVIGMEVFGDVKAIIVHDVIRSLYSGNLEINRDNDKIVYQFAVQFGIEWMMEIARKFFTKTTAVSIDLMKFASLMSQRHSDDFILDLCQDYLTKSNRLNFGNRVMAEEYGQIDVRLLVSIGKYCTFENDRLKIAFFVNWCDENRDKMLNFVELILHTIVQKDALFKQPGSIAILASQLLHKFSNNNLLNFCKTAILEEGFAVQVLNYLGYSKDHESLHVSLVLAICESYECQEVDDLHKLMFVIECCRSDRSKVGELADYIFHNFKLELYKYFNEDKDDLVVQFLQLVLAHGPEEIQAEAKKRSEMLYESFLLKISNSRELSQLVSSDKWGHLNIENIFQLFDRFQHEIDSFTLLGAFGEWVKFNNSRSSKANVQSFLTKFRISDLPLRFAQDFTNLCIWQEESQTLFQAAKYLDASGFFELFAEVILPSKDTTDFNQDEQRNIPSMVTFKRSAGQFTKGSRIMRIKSGKRGNCIRLGFDTSRSPYLFKYPITRKGSINQDSLPLIDVSKDFATIYGMLKGKFINLPFIHPSVLEDMISTARIENEKFVFVVFTKSNTLL